LPTKRPLQRYNDILYNIDAIGRYKQGLDEAAFLADTKTQDAVMLCLLRISEATKKLGPLAEQLAPDQPWKSIRDLGNVLRHDYSNIRLDEIWKVIDTRLLPLREACEHAIQQIHRGLDKPHDPTHDRDPDRGRDR
jgi:uncharacterized protein with HEPN domain